MRTRLLHPQAANAMSPAADGANAASGPARSRGEVAGRFLAAVFGGYAVATASGIAFAHLLRLSGSARADAVLAAMMLSFLVYACAAIWAFAARRMAGAWLGLGGAAAACGVLAWLAGVAA